MRFTSQLMALGLGLSAVGANAMPSPAVQLETRQGPPPGLRHNDFTCKSASHPKPVVLLHGLGATYYEDLNFLEAYLQTEGFCTFSLTYGAFAGFPFVGGLQSIINVSSEEIAGFINEVRENTGANKIDLVGHSEGAFQTLYVTKFGGVSSFIDSVVAIAPPTHGTSFANLETLAKDLGIDNGVDTVLKTFGCPACSELLPGGDAVVKLDDGPITQAGVKYTIIASKYDELVTPTTTAFVNEAGVNNIYIQDYCPLDPVGHIGEAYDLNTWNLVLNALEQRTGRKFFCVLGSPGK